MPLTPTRPFRHTTSALSMALALAGAACLLSVPVGAQVLFPSVPAWTSPVEDTRGVAIGDVNGDGHLDVIRASINGPTVLTLGDGFGFAAEAAWVGPIEPTRAVALGDVDGDGDLDLVRGNNGGGATLYRNLGATFEAAPSWRGLDEITRAVTLADMDGDGDLDLLSANINSGSTLYLNLGGTFASTPAWIAPVSAANGIAVGDVDGDGRLDVVLGNFSTGTTLHLNSSTGLAALPSWTGPAEPTRAVALGDVNGDGRLDLVRGNLGAGSTLTLNSGGTFADTAAWTGPAEPTWAIALGDLDLDGRLDLVRGNSGAVTVTLGEPGSFAAAPAWSGPLEESRSLALLDVDGDGDLDLLRGNLDQGSTLYRNATSPFGMPIAVGARVDARAAALADVDGDGDFDLVRADLVSGATLHLNRGDGFEDAPAWSGEVEATLAVALGDVNGDGSPDLVRGNFDSPATLYLNTGGTFTTTPAWSGPGEITTSVALGDVDGDGDLDLVRGNFDQGATLYLGEGGTFASAPAWRGPVEQTLAVALGDINGDGTLDLVRGNLNAGATLYLNRGGTFDAAPAWTGPVASTAAIALADMDGDGDLDLIRGNTGQPSSLFLNTGGTFATTPAWLGPNEPTVSVAVGDFDGDGDPDLVRGNLGANATLTLSRQGVLDALPTVEVAEDSARSVVAADVDEDGDVDLVLAGTSWAVNREAWTSGDGPVRAVLPQEPAHLRRVRVAALADNRIRLSFHSVDAESDPLELSGEYRTGDDPRWSPMEMVGSTGPFPTSPAGLPSSLEWDVTRLAFDPRSVTIRLRAASRSRRIGGSLAEPTYQLGVGRVVPVRPALALSPDTLAFATVTVGDTAEVMVRIANPGNRDLVLEGAASPWPELTLDLAPGTVVPPGGTRDVIARLSPLTPVPPTTRVELRANDPTQPLLSRVVTTDVRALDFATTLLAIAPELPLGEAATVVVSPAPQVRIEGGWVLHRAAGADAFVDSSALVRQGGNWIALIPSEGVTERGLEYYARVENSRVLRTDPEAAPDQIYASPVAPPRGFRADALPDANGRFPAGRSTPVVVTLPEGAEFEEGTLYFRRGGAATVDSVPVLDRGIVPGLGQPTAEIPGTVLDERGLAYWIRIRTATTLLHDPPGGPEGEERELRVSLDRLSEMREHAGGRYRMLSVPLELDVPAGASIESFLSDQGEFGPPDATRWRAFRWDPATARYSEVAAGANDPVLRPQPGRAFWVITAAAHRVDTAPVPGRSVAAVDTARLTLAPGWNQVGSPFSFTVAWSDVRAMGPTGPVTLEPPVAWDEASQRYRDGDVTRLEPFEGYWLWNPIAGDVELLLMPTEAGVSRDPTLATPSPATAAGEWTLPLRLAAEGLAHSQVRVGGRADAGTGPDAWDRTSPPPAPGTMVQLRLMDPADPRRAPLAADFRPIQDAQGQRFLLDTARPGDAAERRPLRLSWSAPPEDAARFEFVLVDRLLQRAVDLRRDTACTFIATHATGAGAPAPRFELLVGSAAWVEAARAEALAPPTLTRLHAIAPSPMRDGALIRFSLAVAGDTRVEVFDLSGRRVRTLAGGHRGAGVHELAWAGDDDHGHRLAAGMYMVRLVAHGRTDERRVVRL